MLVHGIGEYATRYEELAQALVAAGYAVYGDRLPRPRGDRRAAVRRRPDEARAARAGRHPRGDPRASGSCATSRTPSYPASPIVLLGHSMGSLLRAAHAQRVGRRLRRGDLQRHRVPHAAPHELGRPQQAAPRARRQRPRVAQPRPGRRRGVRGRSADLRRQGGQAVRDRRRAAPARPAHASSAATSRC